MLHLAGQGLAVVVLLKLVLEGGHRLPPPRVALLRHVGLIPEQLPVAQVPAQARRRVALSALASERLDLDKTIRKLFRPKIDFTSQLHNVNNIKFYSNYIQCST